MRKYIKSASLLIFVLCFISLSGKITAFAKDFSYEGFTYTILYDEEGKRTGECCLSGFADGQETEDATVPERVMSPGYNWFTVTGVGDNAFYQNTCIKSITLPDTVRTIGDWSFAGCLSLSDINLISNIETLGVGAFFSCTSLKEVNMDYYGRLTSIGNACFAYSGIQSLRLPQGLKKIEDSAFYMCEDLSYLALPRMLNKIGSGAFTGCSSIDSIFCDPAGGKYKSDNSMITSIDGKILYFWVNPKGDIVIPDGITEIGPYVFENSPIKSVTFPSSLKKIGKGAFIGCTKLKELDFNNKLSSIGDFAFARCSGLTEVILNEDLAYLGEAAFQDCAYLEKLYFGYHLTEIKGNPVAGCIRLKNFEIASANDMFRFENGLVMDYDRSELIFSLSKASSITIPSTVKVIKSWAFQNTTTLQKVVIPESVKKICEGAFYGCSALSYITIKNINIDLSVSDRFSYKDNTTGNQAIFGGIGDGAFFMLPEKADRRGLHGKKGPTLEEEIVRHAGDAAIISFFG